MGMTQTDKNKQLKRNAIRLRMELGWSERRIGKELGADKQTVHRWVKIVRQVTPNIVRQDSLVHHNSTSKVPHNSPLALNKVHVMDCVTGLGRLPHNPIYKHNNLKNIPHFSTYLSILAYP